MILNIKKIRRNIYVLLFCSLIACLIMGMYVITKDLEETSNESKQLWLYTKIPSNKESFGLGGSQLLQRLRVSKNDTYSSDQLKIDNIRDRVNLRSQTGNENIHGKKIQKDKNYTSPVKEINYNVHVFYYMWYGNPQFDGRYLHWNHPRLKHWNKIEAEKWPQHSHVPPDDIGSNYYPELGPYSSQDPKVMEAHMHQIVTAGAGVLAVSWYPPDQADGTYGDAWDKHMTRLMDVANKYKLKVCFHIEPMKDRSPKSIKHWITYIVDNYGEHPAFYRYTYRDQQLPLYYVYDSYQIDSQQWAEVFSPSGKYTVRNTKQDGIFIGLVVESRHQSGIIRGGFDGYYTYFASAGFSYGSTTTNWNRLSREAKKNNQLFIPSVGPGYIDDRVRPWNQRNTKKRDGGKYYEHMFKLAVQCLPPIITITSFNEWHEGTQIERAIPKTTEQYKYLDYSPHEPGYYLNITRTWVERFSKLKQEKSF